MVSLPYRLLYKLNTMLTEKDINQILLNNTEFQKNYGYARFKKTEFNWKEHSKYVAQYCPENLDTNKYNWEDHSLAVFTYCPHLLDLSKGKLTPFSGDVDCPFEGMTPEEAKKYAIYLQENKFSEHDCYEHTQLKLFINNKDLSKKLMTYLYPTFSKYHLTDKDHKERTKEALNTIIEKLEFFIHDTNKEDIQTETFYNISIYVTNNKNEASNEYDFSLQAALNDLKLPIGNTEEFDEAFDPSYEAQNFYIEPNHSENTHGIAFKNINKIDEAIQELNNILSENKEYVISFNE